MAGRSSGRETRDGSRQLLRRAARYSRVQRDREIIKAIHHVSVHEPTRYFFLSLSLLPEIYICDVTAPPSERENTLRHRVKGNSGGGGLTCWRH